jgi:rod shape-determining protein MreC
MTGYPTTTERKVIILVAVLFLNLILVSTNVVLTGKKTLFQSIIGSFVSPLQLGFQETVDYISRELTRYVFLKNNFKNYRELKEKYSQLRYENYLLKKKIIGQDFLRELKLKRKDFIKTDVIAVDVNFPLSSILIDKGSTDGIVKDMIVLNDNGDLVGRIVAPISLFTAKVRLVTSSYGGIGAYIETDLLEGLLTGNNTAVCDFKYLVENKEVKPGDRVITSGTDKIFPPYIPIGQVVAVEKEYLTQKIDVEPFFIKRSIKQLIVITNERQSSTNGE